MKAKLLILALMLATGRTYASGIFSAGPANQQQKFEQAITEASKQNKMVLIVMGIEGCAICEKEYQQFTSVSKGADPDVVTEMEDYYVPLALDLSKPGAKAVVESLKLPMIAGQIAVFDPQSRQTISYFINLRNVGDLFEYHCGTLVTYKSRLAYLQNPTADIVKEKENLRTKAIRTCREKNK